MGRGRRLRKSARTPATERRLAVRLAAESGWDVCDPATGIPSSNHEYEAQAVTWARQILERAGGGLLVIETNGDRRVVHV